jgi:GH15 family glucan-1,4-alpha-glucosidase
MSSYPPIEDYAIVGDGRSAALISREGSLDWLCLPRFDSPSVFAALLDAREGGRFLIRPAGRSAAQRRYVGDSNVLETTFSAEAGVLRLTDCMPVASDEEKRRELTPDHEVLRVLECIEGEVDVELVCDPRPDYARALPRWKQQPALGWFCEHRGQALGLRSEIPLLLQTDRPGLHGRATLRRGQRCALSLTFSHTEPAVLPLLGKEADARLDRSLRWWQDWASRCRYEGPYRDSVVRSALALKLMAYAPSGAIVAAPTSSLPETLGGVRNWDYRFCWLRDASMTFRALFDLGQDKDGEAFLAWLLHATRITWPQLQVLYDVHGRTRLEEQELHHLEGYSGSRPVRIGNGAAEQFQLDVYGEVIDAAFCFVERGRRLDRGTARLLAGLGKTVCRRWREPDEGIWEPRGGRQHYTHSKMMCWVALDRLLRLHEAGHVRVPASAFAEQRDAIRTEIESRGFSEELQSYVSVLDGQEVDASLLLGGLYRYVDPRHPRMRSTCARIRERLGRNGLLYRSNPESGGLPGREGAFGICSFWDVECSALQGDVEAAAAAFEHVLSYANDVGLFAEEIDPDSGAALGNFPQAFTHVGLINAALTLAQCTDPARDDERARRAEVQS